MGVDYRIPQPGEGWRHYKGAYRSLYEVVGVATETESGEPLVVYKEYGSIVSYPIGLFARPLNVWLAMVKNPQWREGGLNEWTEQYVPRFAFERETPPTVVGTPEPLPRGDDERD